jgi:twinkle protein
MRPEITLARMARQATGMRIPTSLSLDAFDNWKKNHLYLLDHHGMIYADSMLAVCRYASTELGIQHIVIDSLMKCVKGEDDFNGQKDFVNALCSIAQDTGMHIHLVHHIRKGSDENHLPGKFDLKGSGSITDQVDNVFIVYRNKRKEKKRQEDGAVNAEKRWRNENGKAITDEMGSDMKGNDYELGGNMNGYMMRVK